MYISRALAAVVEIDGVLLFSALVLNLLASKVDNKEEGIQISILDYI